MMKQCARCANWRHTSEFSNHTYCKTCKSEYNKLHYEENKQKYLKSVAKSKSRRKKLLRDIKEVPCADCGLSYPYYVMDFDHKGDKEFAIAQNHTVALEKLLKEIEKCDIVCANCHRERTHGRKAREHGA